MTLLQALPPAAAGLAALISWRTLAHRPLAFALVAAQALEAFRPELPPWAAWGALLALPALSTWAVRRTLLGQGDATSPLWTLGAWALAWGLLLAAPWSGWWTVALGAAVAAQGAAWRRWRAARATRAERLPLAVEIWREVSGQTFEAEEPRPPSSSELAALVLAFGDAGGLVVGLALGWASVGAWAGAVAALLCVVQLAALVWWRS